MTSPLERIRDTLVVSCQAPPGSPLRGTDYMAAMARAAELGGAGAVRLEGARNVAVATGAVAIPVIGLRKREVEGSEVLITPTLDDALEVVEAGADVVAVDASDRPRQDGLVGDAFVRRLVSELPVPVLADVDTLAAGVAARAAGADAVATTLAGHTGGRTPDAPDLALVALLSEELDCPVLAEGRYGSPDLVRAAFAAGAFAVVVGTAITDPLALTRRFAAAAPRSPVTDNVVGA